MNFENFGGEVILSRTNSEVIGAVRLFNVDKLLGIVPPLGYYPGKGRGKGGLGLSFLDPRTSENDLF